MDNGEMSGIKIICTSRQSFMNIKITYLDLTELSYDPGIDVIIKTHDKKWDTVDPHYNRLIGVLRFPLY